VGVEGKALKKRKRKENTKCSFLFCASVEEKKNARRGEKGRKSARFSFPEQRSGPGEGGGKGLRRKKEEKSASFAIREREKTMRVEAKEEREKREGGKKALRDAFF